MARSKFMGNDLASTGGSRNQTRRHVGRIPIPSFGANATQEAPGGSRAIATVTATSGTDVRVQHLPQEHKHVLPRWNVDVLVQAEGAIATFCATRKRSTLSLEEACHLMKSLQSETQPSVSQPAHENQLSGPQALLLDLLTCASPTLYNLVSNENGKLCLEIVHREGNRMQQLRSLASVQHVSLQKRNSILAQIHHHQNQTKHPTNEHERSAAPKRIKLSVMESIFPELQSTVNQNQPSTTTTTTIHERVTARAQAKNELKQEISDQMALGNPQFTLKVADALWSHSRHILVRQLRLQALSPLRKKKNKSSSTKNTNSSTTRPCVMTMKDIVKLFPDASRRQVLQAMLELHGLAPQWIFFDVQGVTKHTTVWIHSVDYREIRKTLSGPAPLHTAVVVSKPHPQTSPVENLASRFKSMEGRQNDNSPVSSTPPRAHRQGPLPIQVSKESTGQAQDEPSSSSPTTPIPIQRSKVKGIESPLVSGHKRSAQADEILPVRKKKRSGLRINHHLILTDADYDGGEVIAPSYTSPRGLKGLFTQLNAGHRI